jgi:hypothetical protein
MLMEFITMSKNNLFALPLLTLLSSSACYASEFYDEDKAYQKAVKASLADSQPKQKVESPIANDDEDVEMALALSASISTLEAEKPAPAPHFAVPQQTNESPIASDDEDMAMALSLSLATGEAKKSAPVAHNGSEFMDDEFDVEQALPVPHAGDHRHGTISAVEEEIAQVLGLLATIPSSAEELEEQIKVDAQRLELNYGGEKQHYYLAKSVEHKKAMLATLTASGRRLIELFEQKDQLQAMGGNHN